MKRDRNVAFHARQDSSPCKLIQRTFQTVSVSVHTESCFLLMELTERNVPCVRDFASVAENKSFISVRNVGVVCHDKAILNY